MDMLRGNRVSGDGTEVPQCFEYPAENKKLRGSPTLIRRIIRRRTMCVIWPTGDRLNMRRMDSMPFLQLRLTGGAMDQEEVENPAYFSRSTPALCILQCPRRLGCISARYSLTSCRDGSRQAMWIGYPSEDSFDMVDSWSKSLGVPWGFADENTIEYWPEGQVD